ncbi:hypothetical protein CTI12_AA553680 [Artemisia annua]|uniref:TIR domain-containing protein n=1 Tax=Artemisia annua TaxID=35608 RepID=A0A2U1KXJ2_ARTAN|nr:hypothetical protein CTI12_AA553680 [Artemisia annua]
MYSATSSPTSQHTHDHDVFISYNPQDTLKTITGHLITSLTEAQITVYNSDVGSDQLVESIKGISRSRVAVIVFSESYFRSSRCRDEFESIVECEKTTVGKLVIIVINVCGYDVKLCDEFERFGGYLDFNLNEDRSEAEIIQKVVAFVRHEVSYLEERICGKRVLIVLDDLDEINQFRVLRQDNADWFGSGSRIVITTRNEHLLIQQELMRI